MVRVDKRRVCIFEWYYAIRRWKDELDFSVYAHRGNNMSFGRRRYSGDHSLVLTGKEVADEVDNLSSLLVPSQDMLSLSWVPPVRAANIISTIPRSIQPSSHQPLSSHPIPMPE